MPLHLLPQVVGEPGWRRCRLSPSSSPPDSPAGLPPGRRHSVNDNMLSSQGRAGQGGSGRGGAGRGGAGQGRTVCIS